MITPTVTALSFTPVVAASISEIAGSPNLSFSGHVSEFEAIIVTSSHLRHPHSFKRHHQTVHVCKHIQVVLLLLGVVVIEI